MATSEPGGSEVTVKTAAVYTRDLVERVVATYLAAALGVAVAAGPLDLFSASLWEAAGAAGVAAVGSLLKGLAARTRGVANSASLVKDA